MADKNQFSWDEWQKDLASLTAKSIFPEKQAEPEPMQAEPQATEQTTPTPIVPPTTTTPPVPTKPIPPPKPPKPLEGLPGGLAGGAIAIAAQEVLGMAVGLAGNAETKGSVHEYQAGGGSPSGQAPSGAAVLSALNKLAGIRSRM